MEGVGSHSFPLYQIDDASAALILELQREDMQELQRTSKGKRREDDVSDIDFAVGLFQEELDQTSIILADRCMSRSLARAVITDSAMLTDAVAGEDAFANDRMVAERLNDGDDVAECCANDPTLDDLYVARLTALYMCGPSDGCAPSHTGDEQLTIAESSHQAGARFNGIDDNRHECVSCSEYKRAFETFRTPCGHFYCQECLSQLFEKSTKDETLFPPRCCRQGIPLTAARLYLNTDLVQEFQKKTLEFRTGDRTYCSRPTCSAFITSSNITSERATCAACFTETCTICKGNCHEGDCPRDTATQEVLATAAREGWQRCYNCRRLVELDIGCNHMTYV
ncbi:MAG: hypothetical protein LQ337_005577 [Flavoplaca oasis]|nr:MAG: hypothetical protein LQ337_005577 [Flavoplaca oasis]